MKDNSNEKERLAKHYLEDIQLRATLAKHLQKKGCKVTVGSGLNFFAPYQISGKHTEAFIDIYHDAIIDVVNILVEGKFKLSNKKGAIVNFLKKDCSFRWFNHKDNPNNQRMTKDSERVFPQGFDITILEFLQKDKYFLNSLEDKDLLNAINKIVNSLCNKPPLYCQERLRLLGAGYSNKEIANSLEEDVEKYTRDRNYECRKKLKKLVRDFTELKTILRTFIKKI